VTVSDCINPGEIEEGDLMAYVDGLAGEVVRRHIARCAACAREARELGSLQRSLVGQLYRFACPAPESLTGYLARDLDRNDTLVVAQHVRECPHCARELATLAREARSGPGWARRALQVLEAALIQPAGGWEPAAVRGGPGWLAGARRYQADEVEALVMVGDPAARGDRQDVTGLLHVGGAVPEEAGEVTAELYRDDGLVGLAQVSTRGQFSFGELSAGTYDVCLVWGAREIWLRGIEVG
jgi:anti-sigma factor RsiW